MTKEELHGIIVKQGSIIKELNEKIFRIQLTGEIPPLNAKSKSKQKFKRFIKENIDMKKYADRKYLKQVAELKRKEKKLETIINANHLQKKNVSIHKTDRNYIRIAMYLNVEELLMNITNCTEEFYTLPNGYKVKPSSLRYQTFVRNLTCVSCGLKGCFLALEKCLDDFGGNEGDKEGKGYHLNLYSLDKNGCEMLMTKDHILPKSKGGKDYIENMQTMCSNCNNKKGANITENDLKVLQLMEVGV